VDEDRPEGDALSPELARSVLQLGLSDEVHSRLAALSAKAKEGTLTIAERGELEQMLRSADLLAIMKSKARRRLRGEGDELD